MVFPVMVASVDGSTITTADGDTLLRIGNRSFSPGEIAYTDGRYAYGMEYRGGGTFFYDEDYVLPIAGGQYGYIDANGKAFHESSFNHGKYSSLFCNDKKRWLSSTRYDWLDACVSKKNGRLNAIVQETGSYSKKYAIDIVAPATEIVGAGQYNIWSSRSTTISQSLNVDTGEVTTATTTSESHVSFEKKDLTAFIAEDAAKSPDRYTGSGYFGYYFHQKEEVQNNPLVLYVDGARREVDVSSMLDGYRKKLEGRFSDYAFDAAADIEKNGEPPDPFLESESIFLLDGRINEDGSYALKFSAQVVGDVFPGICWTDDYVEIVNETRYMRENVSPITELGTTVYTADKNMYEKQSVSILPKTISTWSPYRISVVATFWITSDGRKDVVFESIGGETKYYSEHIPERYQADGDIKDGVAPVWSGSIEQLTNWYDLILKTERNGTSYKKNYDGDFVTKTYGKLDVTDNYKKALTFRLNDDFSLRQDDYQYVRQLYHKGNMILDLNKSGVSTYGYLNQIGACRGKGGYFFGRRYTSLIFLSDSGKITNFPCSYNHSNTRLNLMKKNRLLSCGTNLEG